MPYPAQTDRETIIETARALIESEGVEQVSLARLAAALGIKAPSLYRHVPSKGALLLAVNELTMSDLFAAYAAARQAAGSAPRAQLLALARAHRAFAHAHPAAYVLAFTTTAPEQRPDAARLEQSALPVQALMAAITGAEQSLAALRGLLALVHGFVMLELKAQFQRGGDLQAAYEAALAAYLDGWQTPATARRKRRAARSVSRPS